jgi:hypothetical protein
LVDKLKRTGRKVFGPSCTELGIIERPPNPGENRDENENLGFSLFQTKDGVNRGFCLWSCAIVVLFITIVM